MMNVVIIGSGNVATVFARLLASQQHTIVQVYSKNIEHAKQLANQYKAHAISNLSEINQLADMYVIAVADKAIETICLHLKLQNQLVVHTAASVSIDVLQQVSTNYGVLYPIQTITKEMKVTTPIPFAVDGNNEFALNKIMSLAKSLTNQVSIYNDEARLKLHVAAIFACNFVNYMYLQSANFCSNENLDFSMLQPIIEETANRTADKHPMDVFTGPAVRGDVATIGRHIQLLKNYPSLEYLYQILSEKIMKEVKLS